MKLKIAILALAACLIGGCQGYVHVDSIDPLITKVADRHDAYVKAGKRPDGSPMTDIEKKVYLDSTAQLRAVLEAAKK